MLEIGHATGSMDEARDLVVECFDAAGGDAMLEVGGDLLDVAHVPFGEADHWFDAGGQHRIVPPPYSGAGGADARQVGVDRTEVFLEDVGGREFLVEADDFEQAVAAGLVEVLTVHHQQVARALDDLLALGFRAAPLAAANIIDGGVEVRHDVEA